MHNRISRAAGLAVTAKCDLRRIRCARYAPAMHLRVVPVAVALALSAAALSACAPTPAEPDRDALQAWVQDPGTEGAGVLASLTATVEAGTEADGPGDGVIVDFPSPVAVDRIEFTCFGEATVSVEAEIAGRSLTRGVGAEGARCDEGTVALDADYPAEVSRVRVNVPQTDVATAWRATVYGAEG